MAPNRRNVPIRDWEAGDSVSGFALLTRYERRQDRNGRDYLDLEIADASGSIAAKVWSDSPALEGDYGAHDFIAFKGTVKSYRDQLQISVQECRRAVEDDRRLGFDEAKLIPSTRRDLSELWETLQAIYGDGIERPELRRLARDTLERHGERLREHPAAKGIHHAYRGGLLEHVVSMAELAGRLCDHYPQLDRGLLLLGVLFHDLGKLVELGAMPANEYTLEGRMVGHVVIGRDLLREGCAAIEDFPAELQLHLEHLVLSHQGLLEFGSPVRPMTAEAFALHFIDDLDSKLNQLERAAEGDQDLVWVRALNRYVYLVPPPGGDGDELPEEAPTPAEAEETEEGSDGGGQEQLEL